MKRTDTNKFTPLFLEHHMLTDNINDVGTLFYSVNGARM